MEQIGGQFEKVLHATVRMLEVREKVKWLHGDNYEKVIAPWKEAIVKISGSRQISPVAVACDMCRAAEVEYNGQAQLLIIAATTEVLSDQKKQSETAETVNG